MIITVHGTYHPSLIRGSSILLVDQTASQQRTTRPTSMPKPMMEADLNISDPTHNRGKVKRINSFTATTEQVETVKRQIQRRTNQKF